MPSPLPRYIEASVTAPSQYPKTHQPWQPLIGALITTPVLDLRPTVTCQPGKQRPHYRRRPATCQPPALDAARRPGPPRPRSWLPRPAGAVIPATEHRQPSERHSIALRPVPAFSMRGRDISAAPHYSISHLPRIQLKGPKFFARRQRH
jgi:hypothetical protein